MSDESKSETASRLTECAIALRKQLEGQRALFAVGAVAGLLTLLAAETAADDAALSSALATAARGLLEALAATSPVQS